MYTHLGWELQKPDSQSPEGLAVFWEEESDLGKSATQCSDLGEPTLSHYPPKAKLGVSLSNLKKKKIKPEES